MKKTRILTAIILLFIGTSVCLAGTRDALWTQVQDALSKGLPQTAIKVLDQIIPGALADKAWAEATKAICMKIAQNGIIQGGKAEEMIVQLQAEIAAAPADALAGEHRLQKNQPVYSSGKGCGGDAPG